MKSVVDSPEVGRALGVLRGKASSGRVFDMRGVRQDGRTLAEYAERTGHRLDGHGHCLACRLKAWELTEAFERDRNYPCAYSTGNGAHDIDALTGNCIACGATREAIDDNLVSRNICKPDGKPHPCKALFFDAPVPGMGLKHSPGFLEKIEKQWTQIFNFERDALGIDRASGRDHTLVVRYDPAKPRKLLGRAADLVVVDDPHARPAAIHEKPCACALCEYVRAMNPPAVAGDGVALKTVAHPVTPGEFREIDELVLSQDAIESVAMPEFEADPDYEYVWRPTSVPNRFGWEGVPGHEEPFFGLVLRRRRAFEADGA